MHDREDPCPSVILDCGAARIGEEPTDAGVGGRHDRRGARDGNTGTPTYGLSPRAARTVKLESDNSAMSNSACRSARKKISSGSRVMNTDATPSIATLPSINGRTRS